MPLLTLSTDIGQQDYLVGAIKGQLLSANANFNITDVTHYLPQDNFPHAAYICSNAFKHFPEETVHIVIINAFETQPQQLLIAKHNNQYIACTDNGILTMIAATKPIQIVALPVVEATNLLELTKLFANAAHQLSKGKSIIQLGETVTTIVEKSSLRPTIGNDWMDGHILFIDNFENVVINVTQAEFEEHRKGRKFKIAFNRHEAIDTISSNYAAVHEGDKLAWFNAAGYLELAINKGNMAGLFGLESFNAKMQQGSVVQNKWFYQSVRIFFE